MSNLDSLIRTANQQMERPFDPHELSDIGDTFRNCPPEVCHKDSLKSLSFIRSFMTEYQRFFRDDGHSSQDTSQNSGLATGDEGFSLTPVRDYAVNVFGKEHLAPFHVSEALNRLPLDASLLDLTRRISDRLGIRDVALVDDQGSFISGGMAASCGLMSIDGQPRNDIYFDRDGMSGLSVESRAAVLAHECAHIALQHSYDSLNPFSFWSGVVDGALGGLGALFGGLVGNKLMREKVNSLKIPVLGKPVRFLLRSSKVLAGAYAFGMLSRVAWDKITGTSQNNKRQEFEADELAARALGSKSMMINMFKELDQSSSFLDDVINPPALAAHPSAQARIRAIEALNIPD